MSRVLTVSFLVVSFSLFIFSYLWVDRALIYTLAESRPSILNLLKVVDYGNHHRANLAIIYIALLALFFFLKNTFLLRSLTDKFAERTLFLVFLITTLIFTFSYNFLSNDLFTYLFSAKMLWFYHLNPYIVAPKELIEIDFSISFLRNIQNTYFYGPIALAYSSIPVIILSANKILSNLILIRLMNATLFYLTGILIYKITDKDKRIFGWWFFNPMLVIELLVNAHNDLLLISSFVISVYFINRKRVLGLVILAFSSLTKFAEILGQAATLVLGGLPILLTEKLKPYYFKLVFLLFLVYLTIGNVLVRPWYYTWIFMFIPFARLKTVSLIIIDILSFMFVANYYSYIKTGFWSGPPLISRVDIWTLTGVLLIIAIEFGPLGRYLIGNMRLVKLSLNIGKK